MNFKFLHLIPFLLLTAFIFSFKDGPAGGEGGSGPRMQDRSGSPYAIAQGPTCAACHNNGSFNPGVIIELLQDGNPVVEYVPEASYKLRYTVMANSGTPSKFGIQSIVLENNDDTNIGTFGTAPAGTRVASISSRQYFEHTTPSASDTFEIEWIAPAAGAGELTVYAGSVAANGNGTNGGDNGAASTLILTETPDVSTMDPTTLLSVMVTIAPNPVVDMMNVAIESGLSGKFSMRMHDFTGKSVLSRSVEVHNGRNQFSENISHLPSGLYLLQITDGKRQRVVKVLK